MKFRGYIHRTVIGRSLKVLSSSDRRKLGLITLVQVSLSFLDLLGVAAIGLLGALSVSGLQSLNPDKQIVSVLKVLQIENDNWKVIFTTQTKCSGISDCERFR